jgi:hypothetical protein
MPLTIAFAEAGSIRRIERRNGLPIAALHLRMKNPAGPRERFNGAVRVFVHFYRLIG